MNYFPNGQEEINLLKFIAKYQYLKGIDAKYFFTSKRYYQTRITSLLNKKYLKRSNKYLILDKKGIEYIRFSNCKYNRVNRNKIYQERLKYISHIGAYFNNSNIVSFTPSFCMKNKESYTTTARKYIGKFNINGFEYLAYHISNIHDKKYILSVAYDIQKEKYYKNIIIIADNIDKLNINDFIFGNNSVLLIENKESNFEKLEYMHNINWSKIVHDNFPHTSLSEYNFCEYTDHRKNFISTFYFLDTEKINKINTFLRENKNKNFYILCTNVLKDTLQKYLPKANYKIIELENYIERSQNIYS